MTSHPTGTVELKTALTKSLKTNALQHPATSMGLKSNNKTPAVIEKQLHQRMLGILRKNHIDPQLLNMLRYELYRLDTDRTMLVPSKTFKDIYRNLNIKMSLEDFNFFMEFMKLNARNFKEEYDEKSYLDRMTAGTPQVNREVKLDEEDLMASKPITYKREKVQLKDCSLRMTLNLRNLSKLIETLAKIYWTRMKEKLDEYNLTSNEFDDPEKLAIQKELREN